MRHATRAYGAIANQTASPRELEADLLLNAAARLQAIHDGWSDKNSELDAALRSRHRWEEVAGDVPGIGFITPIDKAPL